MPSPSSPAGPSAPWALLWLGGVAAAAWAPLLLADSLPRTPTAGPPLTAAAQAGRAITSLGPPPPLVGHLPEAPSALGERTENPMAPFPPTQPKGVERRLLAGLEAPAAPAPTRLETLPGSMLLGGPLTLASLQEKPMVPAARIEQTLRASSADRLSAVPAHWRPTMEALIQGKNQVMPAEVVRLPAPHLKQPEEYPMAVQADGVAETPVNPPAPSRQALERWAERQSPTPQGTVRPVVVVLEPLAAEPSP
jgi:hypothetical protein